MTTPLRELPWPADPSVWLDAIRHLPWTCWLDSGPGLASIPGRWHILVAGPRRRVLAQGRGTLLVDVEGRQRFLDESPLAVIRQGLAERPRPSGPVPFTGGALGYLSYDFGHRLLGLRPRAGAFPEVAVGLYDWAILLDGKRQRAYLAGEGFPRGLVQRLEEAARRPPPAAADPLPGAPRFMMGRDQYRRAFERIQHYLREGDCYQVNYAQPFEAPYRGDALALYLALRRRNAVPFGAYLEYPFGQVLCASPERFLQLHEGRVTTRPIKGTRPRGTNPEEDGRLARALAQSEKDRAENVMIVDLLRNDLGRVCRPGSIEVPALFEVEGYATVWHLVSTVEGRLRAGEDAVGLLAAAFPGGSITGAPKRRAMEIIDELEILPRGLYCGTIGWIGYDGNMDTNIAIRTLQLAHGRLRYWAGGGIVADSHWEGEYQESLDKAAPFFELFENRP